MHRGHSFTASNATPPAKYKMAGSGPHGLIPWFWVTPINFCCLSFWSEHSFYEKRQKVVTEKERKVEEEEVEKNSENKLGLSWAKLSLA